MTEPEIDPKHEAIGRTAYWGLVVLTFINLFNYLDRIVLSALVPSLKAEFGFSDTQLGALQTGFVVVYMLVSPIFGWLGDRRSRRGIVAGGVALWSLATAAGGLARGFGTLFAARASIGIGEAAYGTIAPAMIADYFPKRLRGRVFAFFFLAIPVGSALGYVVGGLVDAALGWRAAFLIAGLPGILLALLMFTIKEPERGAHDEPEEKAKSEEISGWEAYKRLAVNRAYAVTVAGYAAYTFALGALAFWMPAFLVRVRGVESADATVQLGGILVVTGIIGTAGGGILSDYLLRYTRQAYLWVSAVATILAVPFAFIALMAQDSTLYLGALVLAEILVFASTGPINSVIVEVVPPNMRATAVAASILAIHVFGDVPSPPLIGWISDSVGLDKAILIVPVAFLVSGVIWALAALQARSRIGGTAT